MKISIIVIVNKKRIHKTNSLSKQFVIFRAFNIFYHFGSHPPTDLHPKIFWSILQHCEIGIFLQFGYYLRREWSDFHQNFITHVMMYPWTRKSPLNFGSNSNPESGSEVRIWIRTPDPDRILGGHMRTNCSCRPKSLWKFGLQFRLKFSYIIWFLEQFHVLQPGRHFDVLHFHVRHFHALSCPAISCLATWSVIFTSRNFMSCIFSAPFQRFQDANKCSALPQCSNFS